MHLNQQTVPNNSSVFAKRHFFRELRGQYFSRYVLYISSIPFPKIQISITIPSLFR